MHYKIISLGMGAAKTHILARSGITLLTLVVAFSGLTAQQQNRAQSSQDQDDGSRQVTLETFTRARPRLPTPPIRIGSRRRPIAVTGMKPPRYRRKTAPLPTSLNLPTLDLLELGLTIWRLRPFQTADRGARLLVMDGGQSSQWIPERIEVDQPLALGERVRISIESPRPGYLYVIDREQYADGTMGLPYLIFPTTRTRAGNNLVKPGMLIDIPGQDDLPPYFTLNSMNPKYAGEVLTVIVLSHPLEGLTIGRQPLVLPVKQLASWEKQLGSMMERFEMDGGAGTPWTAAEQAAALASGGRSLTQDEPAPQTIYRVAAKTVNGLLIHVPIRYQR